MAWSLIELEIVINLPDLAVKWLDLMYAKSESGTLNEVIAKIVLEDLNMTLEAVAREVGNKLVYASGLNQIFYDSAIKPYLAVENSKLCNSDHHVLAEQIVDLLGVE